MRNASTKVGLEVPGKAAAMEAKRTEVQCMLELHDLIGMVVKPFGKLLKGTVLNSKEREEAEMLITVMKEIG